MDEEKRSEYDEFGEVDADGLSGLSGKSFDELYKHFRAMHAAVTEADLDEWAEKYPGSSMERQDLLDYYERFEGNMKNWLNYIPFAEKEDGWRVKEVLDSLIASGELESTPAYERFKPTKLSQAEVDQVKSKRLRKAARGENDTRGGGGGGGGGGGDRGSGGSGVPSDLMALIASNQQKRAAQSDTMLDALAAKYAKPPAKKKKPQGKKKR